jgi:hypothetical protein
LHGFPASGPLRSFAGRSLLIIVFQRTGHGRDDRSDSTKHSTAFRSPVPNSTSKGNLHVESFKT